MGDGAFDLFGNPVRPGHGQRGRPPFEVTDKSRNKVKLLLALGWSNERIAHAIEVSVATLKRYFRAELKVRDQMRDRLDAERIFVLADKAMAGDIGAQRELSRQIDRNDMMAASRRLADAQAKEPRAQKERVVGKKEAALEAAAESSIDTEWGGDLDFTGSRVN